MKILYSVLVLCIGNTIQARQRLATRIHGGELAVEKEFPYQVALTKDSGQFFCGGSILNNYYVLTAAHCVYPYSNDEVLVRMGSIDWKKNPAHEVDSIIMHDDFEKCKSGLLENDLALLRLKIRIEFDDYNQPIPLIDYEIPDQSEVVAMGWGETINDFAGMKTLHKITLIKINHDICKKQYKDEEQMDLGDGKICTYTKYGEGICDGDSGSPLMYQGKLVGVTSFGRKPCSTGLPDGFADVYYYRNWILPKITESSK